MLKLGVNIDHVATLREARYRGHEGGEPDPVAAALECEAAGAHGITAHLREDRRHIQDRDVWQLRERITTRLNLELANAAEIIDIAFTARPATGARGDSLRPLIAQRYRHVALSRRYHYRNAWLDDGKYYSVMLHVEDEAAFIRAPHAGRVASSSSKSNGAPRAIRNLWPAGIQCA